MTARRRWPGAGALVAGVCWCGIAVLGPGAAGAEGTPPAPGLRGDTLVATVGAPAAALAPARSALPPDVVDATRRALPVTATDPSSGPRVAVHAAPRGRLPTASSASATPSAAPVGTATSTSSAVRSDERRPVGSVLRILIAGFLLVAAGLTVATWWYVRATRPVASRRTV